MGRLLAELHSVKRLLGLTLATILKASLRLIPLPKISQTKYSTPKSSLCQLGQKVGQVTSENLDS